MMFVWCPYDLRCCHHIGIGLVSRYMCSNLTFGLFMTSLTIHDTLPTHPLKWFIKTPSDHNSATFKLIDTLLVRATMSYHCVFLLGFEKCQNVSNDLFTFVQLYMYTYIYIYIHIYIYIERDRERERERERERSVHGFWLLFDSSLDPRLASIATCSLTFLVSMLH